MAAMQTSDLTKTGTDEAKWYFAVGDALSLTKVFVLDSLNNTPYPLASEEDLCLRDIFSSSTVVRKEGINDSRAEPTGTAPQPMIQQI